MHQSSGIFIEDGFFKHRLSKVGSVKVTTSGCSKTVASIKHCSIIKHQGSLKVGSSNTGSFKVYYIGGGFSTCSSNRIWKLLQLFWLFKYSSSSGSYRLLADYYWFRFCLHDLCWLLLDHRCSSVPSSVPTSGSSSGSSTSSTNSTSSCSGSTSGVFRSIFSNFFIGYFFTPIFFNWLSLSISFIIFGDFFFDFFFFNGSSSSSISSINFFNQFLLQLRPLLLQLLPLPLLLLLHHIFFFNLLHHHHLPLIIIFLSFTVHVALVVQQLVHPSMVQ